MGAQRQSGQIFLKESGKPLERFPSTLPVTSIGIDHYI